MSYIQLPRCLHGAVWNECDECARTIWCEDCNERLVLEEPVDHKRRETVTCMRCVDRMIGND